MASNRETEAAEASKQIQLADDLPDEMLLHIASFLPAVEDILNLSQTAHRFKEVVDSEYVWDLKLNQDFPGESKIACRLDITKKEHYKNLFKKYIYPFYPIKEKKYKKLELVAYYNFFAPMYPESCFLQRLRTKYSEVEAEFAKIEELLEDACKSRFPNAANSQSDLYYLFILAISNELFAVLAYLVQKNKSENNFKDKFVSAINDSFPHQGLAALNLLFELELIEAKEFAKLWHPLLHKQQDETQALNLIKKYQLPYPTEDNLQTNYSSTPLLIAIAGNKLQIAKYILAQNLAQNEMFRALGYLHNRTDKTRDIIGKLLLEKNAGITSKYLFQIAQYKDLPTLRLLLENGLDPNVSFLLDDSELVDIKPPRPSSGKREFNLLSIAISKGNFDLIKLLLEYGADPSAVNSVTYNNAEHAFKYIETVGPGKYYEELPDEAIKEIQAKTHFAFTYSLVLSRSYFAMLFLAIVIATIFLTPSLTTILAPVLQLLPLHLGLAVIDSASTMFGCIGGILGNFLPYIIYRACEKLGITSLSKRASKKAHFLDDNEISNEQQQQVRKSIINKNIKITAIVVYVSVCIMAAISLWPIYGALCLAIAPILAVPLALLSTALVYGILKQFLITPPLIFVPGSDTRQGTDTSHNSGHDVVTERQLAILHGHNNANNPNVGGATAGAAIPIGNAAAATTPQP